MQFINIGFGNLVSVQRLIAVVSPDSAPVKRLVQNPVTVGCLSTLPTAARRPRCSLWTATMWCCPPWRRSVWHRAWDCR